MDNFIERTAEDYDIDYDTVKHIRDMYPDTFYEELEEYIKHRDNGYY